jgi:hypothetical protein
MLEKISYFFGSLVRNHPTSKELSKIINSLRCSSAIDGGEGGFRLVEGTAQSGIISADVWL